MVFSVGGSFAYFARNVRYTVTTDLLVWYSNTQNDFSPGAAIFSLRTLASPSGRNVNYNKKNYWGGGKFLNRSFYLYRFRKYMSYGFPMIILCNPGVPYEKLAHSSLRIKSLHMSCKTFSSFSFSNQNFPYTFSPTAIATCLHPLPLPSFGYPDSVALRS